jgi:MtfA peptidase
MWNWWRNRRRRAWLAQPWPADWERILQRNLYHFAHLTAEQRDRLRGIVTVLVREKNWEASQGFSITHEMQVTVAGHAALLLLGMPHDFYTQVESIIIYPTTFSNPNPEDETFDDELDDPQVQGLASYRGAVVVAWDAVVAEGREALGHNVVLHEFAHQLDFLDTYTNGTPPLSDPKLAAEWGLVMEDAFSRHVRRLDRGEETMFTEHAGTEPGEFFADATEAFFCSPHDLQAEEPGVYRLLGGYFALNPVEWFPRVDVEVV